MGLQKSGKSSSEKAGGSPSVLVDVSGKMIATALHDHLKKSLSGEVTVTKDISFWNGDGRQCCGANDLGGYDAVIAGMPAEGPSLAERFSSARKNGYNGMLVAVLLDGEESEAVGLTAAGADHILLMPPREVELDILAEKLRSRARTSGSGWRVLRDLLQPVEQGVVLLDGGRDLIFANRCARSTLSLAKDEEISAVIEANCTDSVFEKCRLEGSAVTYADVPVPGRETHRLLGMEVLYLEDHCDEQFYLVLIHDFSRWKKLDELRSKFATSLSHRMRTPLTSIRNAVRLLGECEGISGDGEKERLVDIGWRNVEKLITNLDELQKIFMIESEELNVCRTMVRLRNEMNTVLEESAESGKLRGFKLSAPDMMIFTGKGRMRDFLASAIDAYDLWLSEKPFLECSTSIREDCDPLGAKTRKLVIYIRPRTMSRLRSSREGLREFLSLNEAHRGLVLGRLATALDAELQISPGNTISLTLPLDPEFSREKDLVHPLHMMIERSDISSSPFSLVTLTIQGESARDPVSREILQKVLSQHAGGDLMVALGEEPGRLSLFVNDRQPEEVEQLMTSLRREFLRTCRERGLEIYPSLGWDIRYVREAGANSCPIERLLATEMA
ncbi:MAG TPA: histidine kinase dimerization/phospho-acceptor domain-containing protein [Candidatus Krumholzibacterium sp.]|nr:histidine kinase dimerization/phospho-acceptor domain-containing protein [Candidatus Krumholzibacterium sp.]